MNYMPLFLADLSCPSCTWWILLMLTGAFLLGLLLGWILWNRFKNQVDGLIAEKGALRKQLIEAEKNQASTKYEAEKAQRDLLSYQAVVRDADADKVIFNNRISKLEKERTALEQRIADFEKEQSNWQAQQLNIVENIPTDAEPVVIEEPHDSELETAISSSSETTPVETEDLPEVIEAANESELEVEAVPEIDPTTSPDYPALEEVPILDIEIAEASEEDKMMTNNMAETILSSSAALGVVAAASTIEEENVSEPKEEVVVHEVESAQVDIIEDIAIADEDPEWGKAVDMVENLSASVSTDVAIAAEEEELEKVVEIIEQQVEIAAPTELEMPVVDLVDRPTLTSSDEEIQNLLAATDKLVAQPNAKPNRVFEIDGINYRKTFSNDNLQIIEGIGPKIEQLLKANEIASWEKLALTPVDKLKELLNEAGAAYRIHDPSNWAEQADLAQRDKWAALIDYQKFMNDPENQDEGGAFSKAERLALKVLGFSNNTQNLKVVEGIGSKIEKLLKAAGITSWEHLANAELESLQAILEAAGDNYRLAKPETWAEQARLAHEGKWQELKKFQEEQVG